MNSESGYQETLCRCRVLGRVSLHCGCMHNSCGGGHIRKEPFEVIDLFLEEMPREAAHNNQCREVQREEGDWPAWSGIRQPQKPEYPDHNSWHERMEDIKPVADLSQVHQGSPIQNPPYRSTQATRRQPHCAECRQPIRYGHEPRA